MDIPLRWRDDVSVIGSGIRLTLQWSCPSSHGEIEAATGESIARIIRRATADHATEHPDCSAPIWVSIPAVHLMTPQERGRVAGAAAAATMSPEQRRLRAIKARQSATVRRRPRVWTEEADRLALTLSTPDAAERLGVSLSAVRQRRALLRRTIA